MPNRSAGQNNEHLQSISPYRSVVGRPEYHHHGEKPDEEMEDDDDAQSLRKRTEMLKLAHIVSTFG
jgi:hypothetical protein